MSTVHEIPTPEAFHSHLSSLPPTTLRVLYFHAPWAQPCVQMSQVLRALASTYPPTTPPSISFLSLNAEDLPDISEEHDVTAVPLVILQRGEQTLATLAGSDAARVRDAVEEHAGAAAQDGAALPKLAAALPAAQEVARPAQPLPRAPSEASAKKQAEAKGEAGTGGTQGPAKDLSAYAPGAKDAKTAPEYSSGTPAGLSADSSNGPEGADANGDKEALHARLKELTSAAPCMLFMKGTPSAPQCGFSRQLVSILRDSGVRYGFFNILADDEVRQGLKEYADWPTFPQLWLGGELVGGLDIVREEMEADPGFFAEYSVKKGKVGGPAADGMSRETVGPEV